MNVSNMRKIMISHGKAQESFLFEMKQVAQRLMGEQYDAVYDFFYDVLEHHAMYKIICARRCQVLFELFGAIILLENSDLEVNGTFISSNAMERHLEMLSKKDVSVLIVDDVLIHGRGVKRLYECIDPDYTRNNVEIAVFCRAINASCIDERLRKRILEGYPPAFDYEWRETSCRFVDLIETSAIPYESFAGSLVSFTSPVISSDNAEFRCICNSDKSHIFFEKRDAPPFLKTISYDICLRTYSNSKLNAFFAVPYVVLRNIKKSICYDFFASIAKHLNPCNCRYVIDELLGCSEQNLAYRMRLLSGFVNRIYGLYLSHTYGILKDAEPNLINLVLCFGRDVADELVNLRWEDISDLLDFVPPFEDGLVQEDDDLSSYLLMPDDCKNDGMYRFLSMYYYINGQLDETAVKENRPRRCGLTIGHFYKATVPEFYHELTAAQIKCWDYGQASGIVRSRRVEDCVATYGVAGEQNFRFILQENREFFGKRSKDYALSFLGSKAGHEDDKHSSFDSEEESSRFIAFNARNKDLLSQFLKDNEGSLEEWYIPQFIS